mgnify:FL=1
MKLHTLSKVTARSKKRLGRGPGSGREKTSGRGTKGMNARNKSRLGYEGGQLPLIKRLPFIRGKSRNKSYNANPFVINVGDLAVLPKGT